MKINQRLFDHYGIDTNKDHGIKQVCARPYDTLLIDKQGSCYACECTAWLPQSVGNLHKHSLSEILQSSTRKHLQSSVSDGTYRYCNDKLCTYMSKNIFDERSGDPIIKHLRLAIDDSCNLACPSCRKEKIFLHRGGTFKMRMRVMNRVVDYLRDTQNPIRVHIGSDGDPFASVIYRAFMREVAQEENLSYSFQTNGLLFKQMFPRVKQVVASTKQLNVSIDGATKGTYEKLRKGGTWEKIHDSLQFIGEKKTMGYLYELHMVVQRSNWREMDIMCELGRSVGADKVKFSMIADWNTFGDFQKQLPPLDDPEFIETVKRCESNGIGHTWLNPKNL